MTDGSEQAREAFARGAWGASYEWLSVADRECPLGLDDLERLATAAYLVGHDEESVEVWARAHQESARLGDAERAARCAFWLAFGLMNKGDLARGGGWVDRTLRLLDEGELDCVERGYLRYLVGVRAVFEGDAARRRPVLRGSGEYR